MDKYETDKDSEFTLDVDLRGAGGPFRDLSVANAAPDALAMPVEGLEVGKTYEWYAEVASCGQKVTTPLYRFTTMASARAAQELNQTLQQPPRRKRTQHVTSGPVDVAPDDPALVD
jgi:hypothetical protein